MDIKKMIEDIDKIDYSNLINETIDEIEKWTWKNEGHFLDFLKELVDYLDEYKRIDSEEFLYDSEKNPFTVKENYTKYIESLTGLIYSYSDKYKLPLINCDLIDELYFTELCLLLKYQDKFYKIERMSGQGTVDMIYLYEGNTNTFFIEYDLIIKGLPPHNYKDIIMNTLKQSLNDFKDTYSEELKILRSDIVIKEDD